VTQPRPVYNFRLFRGLEILAKTGYVEYARGLVSDPVAKTLIIGRLIRP